MYYTRVAVKQIWKILSMNNSSPAMKPIDPNKTMFCYAMEPELCT